MHPRNPSQLRRGMGDPFLPQKPQSAAEGWGTPFHPRNPSQLCRGVGTPFYPRNPGGAALDLGCRLVGLFPRQGHSGFAWGGSPPLPSPLPHPGELGCAERSIFQAAACQHCSEVPATCAAAHQTVPAGRTGAESSVRVAHTHTCAHTCTLSHARTCTVTCTLKDTVTHTYRVMHAHAHSVTHAHSHIHSHTVTQSHSLLGPRREHSVPTGAPCSQTSCPSAEDTGAMVGTYDQV